METENRPGPVPDEDSRPYWEALAAHRLPIQACLTCEELRCPPLPACARCGGVAFRWQEATGRGRIYSWVVAHRAIGNLTPEDLPRTILTVELDEGCRLLGRLIGATRPKFDAVVTAEYVDHPGWTELAFVPLGVST